MSLEKAAGAAGTLQLNGTLLTICRPSARDMAKYRAFIRQQLDKVPSPLLTIRDDLKLLPKRERQAVLKMAYDNRMSIRSLSSPQAAEIMEGNDSTAYLLWLCARRDHPDLTYEKVLEGVEASDLETIQDAMESVLGDKKKEQPDGVKEVAASG